MGTGTTPKPPQGDTAAVPGWQRQLLPVPMPGGGLGTRGVSQPTALSPRGLPRGGPIPQVLVLGTSTEQGQPWGHPLCPQKQLPGELRAAAGPGSRTPSTGCAGSPPPGGPGGSQPGLGPPRGSWQREKMEQKVLHLLRAEGSLNKCPFSVGKLPQGMVLWKEKHRGVTGGAPRP